MQDIGGETQASFYSSATPEGIRHYHGKNVDGIFHRWSTIWLSDSFAKWNMEAFLKGVTAPVLAFQGADDHYGEPGQLMSITEKTGGTSQRVMIPGCGHIPHLQAFDAVASKAVEFINNGNSVLE